MDRYAYWDCLFIAAMYLEKQGPPPDTDTGESTLRTHLEKVIGEVRKAQAAVETSEHPSTSDWSPIRTVDLGRDRTFKIFEQNSACTPALAAFFPPARRRFMGEIDLQQKRCRTATLL
jgi:hypothetical protein